MHFTRLFRLETASCTTYAACLNHQRAFRLISGNYTYSYAVFSLFRIRNNHHGSLNLSHPVFHGLKLQSLYFGRSQCSTEVSRTLSSGGRPCKGWGAVVHLYHTPFNHTAGLSEPGRPHRQVPTLGGPMSPFPDSGDLTRPHFTSEVLKRPESGRRPFVQTVFESLVCPQQALGEKQPVSL